MEFTFKFIQFFYHGLILGAPLLGFLVLLIVLLGQIAGRLESWSRFDALYWSFITATTVGYGDIRPKAALPRIISVLIAFTGVVFTGITVALAINAAEIAFSSMHEGRLPSTVLEEIGDTLE